MSKPSSHTVYRKPYFSRGANLESGDLGTTYWPVPHYVTCPGLCGYFVVSLANC